MKASITITIDGTQTSYFVDEEFAGELLFMCETSTSAMADDISPMLHEDIMLDSGGCSLFDLEDDDYDEEDNDWI